MGSVKEKAAGENSGSIKKPAGKPDQDRSVEKNTPDTGETPKGKTAGKRMAAGESGRKKSASGKKTVAENPVKKTAKKSAAVKKSAVTGSKPETTEEKTQKKTAGKAAAGKKSTEKKTAAKAADGKSANKADDDKKAAGKKQKPAVPSGEPEDPASSQEILQALDGLPGSDQLAKLILKGKKENGLSSFELLETMESLNLDADQSDRVYDVLETMGIATVDEAPADLNEDLDEQLPEDELEDISGEEAVDPMP